ncbi:YpdA family putative bacillithiol disulfide reductase [Aureibacter tunicatorum]|uniref:Thioredoxin reductase (NADPH) n=1 Tax=Aureibacter tunicatorum TaxID=866807 RepID=A0AAE4BQF5_9BACT|nr:YpdA family putative bacillithiol disulfide reductase [Aureibacter tunicatorum]MDR6239049.1 thioredoxin reductase (NADPH) [Aureibacter tunicatorum]BDD05025.1 pyridine nucleotide-disulfide oxidoreductase [Aureibacter tunicatorum]
MTYDVIIIGAGPCGLSVGIEAQSNQLSHLILDKGTVAESIRQYPLQMKFFSTRENIEIGNIPFAIREPKASREEALTYYRKVAEHYQLNLELQTEVESVAQFSDGLKVQTKCGKNYIGKNVVIATGYFDNPRKLNIPGEELPHVENKYREPYKYAFSRVIIIGGGNSAVETALDLHRNGADVTLLVKENDFKPTAKYWLVPDLNNRIKEGKIKASFNTTATEIEKNLVHTKDAAGQNTSFECDYVLTLIGHTTDTKLLKSCQIKYSEDLIPAYDANTFETNIPNLYVSGTVICGTQTEKVFIENGRLHGKAIINNILNKQAILEA